MRQPDYSSTDAYFASTISLDELANNRQFQNHYLAQMKDMNAATLPEFQQQLVPYLKALGVRRIGIETDGGSTACVARIGADQVLRVSLAGAEKRYDTSALPIALQPLFNTQVGPFSVEVYPHVQNVDAAKITKQDVAFCAVLAKIFGFTFWDCREANVGRLPNGLPVILDPGSVVPSDRLHERSGLKGAEDASFQELLDDRLVKDAVKVEEMLRPLHLPWSRMDYRYDLFGGDKRLRDADRDGDDTALDKALARHPLGEQLKLLLPAFEDKKTLVQLFDVLSTRRESIKNAIRNYYQTQLHALRPAKDINDAVSNERLIELVSSMRGEAVETIDDACEKSVIARSIVHTGFDKEGFRTASLEAAEDSQDEPGKSWRDLLRLRYGTPGIEPQR